MEQQQGEDGTRKSGKNLFHRESTLWKHTALLGTFMFQAIVFKIMQTVSIWHAIENIKFYVLLLGCSTT